MYHSPLEKEQWALVGAKKDMDMIGRQRSYAFSNENGALIKYSESGLLSVAKNCIPLTQLQYHVMLSSRAEPREGLKMA